MQPLESTLAGYRLSPLQRRLWRWSPERGPFLSQVALVSRTTLDRRLLRAALERTVGRHEVLRTLFPRLPGMEVPLQEVREELGFTFEELASGPLEGEAALEAVEREFDLARGPLLRCALVPARSGGELLVLALPALVADSTTLLNLAGEIAAQYRALEEHGEVAGEATQYIDFSEWHNDLPGTGENGQALAFWQRQNLGSLKAFDLPFERRPPLGASFAPRKVGGVVVRLPEELDPDVEQSLLLAAWQALLGRLAGGGRLSVSVRFDGRRMEPLREALGLFQSYLPVAAVVQPRTRFSDLQMELLSRIGAMREWQEYFPWDGGEGEVVDVEYLASPPVAFEYQRLPERIGERGVDLRVSALASFTEPFRLRLTAWRRSGGAVALELAYDSVRFAAIEAQRLLGWYEALLRSALSDGGRRIGDLDLLGEGERQQVLREWNDTARSWEERPPVHGMIALQAERHPDRLAVRAGGEHLSFGELWSRASRSASYLRRRGVTRGSRVGLSTERSVGMVVWMVSVLQAGGAYVPLEPEQPGERLRRIVEEAGASVLVWGGKSQPTWAEGLAVVGWSERGAVASMSPCEVSSEDLAYVLFTSGSTGRPKGVMVRHGSLANLLSALEERIYGNFGVGRVGVNAPFFFDGSVKQWLQLCQGRPLELIPEWLRADAEGLWSLVREREIESLDGTPSQLRLLLEGDDWESVPLRRLLVGGEELSGALWERLSDWSVESHNVYGPTECTVDATESRVVVSASPSIGRPLRNVRTYVVGSWGGPVAAGLTGELWIGGAGLARGYAGRAEATAERFVPDPFGGERGGRLYRTGDLARYSADGRLECLGRLDHQVKLRGVRVELGEIESVLLEHGRVRSAVAMVREDRPGERRLVGYVVPRSGSVSGPAAGWGRELYGLPNGMRIAQLNRIETDYLYQEIFEQFCYLRHGVTLPKGSVVVDVGANIGMFTLFVGRESPGSRVYAFEPIAEIAEALRYNASQSGAEVKCFGYGLGAAEGSETFLFYPEFSARSGLAEYADAESEVEVIKRYIGNEERLGVSGAGELLAQVDELLEGRFVGEQVESRVRRLSDVLSEEGIERVDLLKVDVQRAERRVLEGISSSDWSRIGQVAMEVHDDPSGESAGRVAWVRELLEREGFRVVIEQDELLVGTDRYNVYAVRDDFVRWREQWGAERGSGALVEVGGEEADLYTLPNGLRIAQQNRNESDFIYEQIFGEEVYRRHGVEIWEGDRIFDVGANIGLFTLYAHQWPEVEVHSFEPIPSSFEKLESNVRRYGLGARLYRCALGRESGRARFTFYPKWSASSGQYADEAMDLASAREFLVNRDSSLSEYADEILEGRFVGEPVECEVRTLSEVLSEIDRVDLLKLDVEKSELDILEGLAESDWPKVQQVVVEVHDLGGRLDRLRHLLEEHGLRVAVEQDELAVGTGIYTLYGRRPGHRQGLSGGGSSRSSLVQSSGGELTVSELTSYLSSRLPAVMVPSELVFLPELPYTRSGKVDRGALPTPESLAQVEERWVEGPRDPYEEVLVGLWSEVLQKSPIGIDESFFSLGGHSLLATQLISRVRSAFSIELPLRSLFEHPTIAELAREVEKAKAAGEGLAVPPIERVPRTGDLPLSFAQQRLWFIDQLEPGSAIYNCPHPLALTGTLNVEVLARTVAEVERRHESLRTRFGSVEGRPVQIIDPPGRLRLWQIDLRGLEAAAREREAQRLVFAEARQPFDLARGPLVRVGVVHLEAEEPWLLFTMHHIVSDGRSMEVLVREVAALYGAFLEGKPSPLPELAVQYADFASWQRSWLSGEVLSREVDYWRRRLVGAPPVLALPLDRPRPPRRDPRSGSRGLQLDRELSEALRTLSRRQGATLFMTLLAAFHLLLARYSGQEDVCIGVPIAGRNRGETERLIGFFINTLVMRASLAGNPSFEELLGQVKEGALEAYAHQDAPFDKLVEELVEERSLTTTPLFQVTFALEDNPQRKLELPNLSLRPLSTGANIGKFDLMLALVHFGEEVAGGIGYSAALFDASTVGRLAEHLILILSSIVADPGAPSLDLPLLSSAESHQALHEWNDTASAYPAATVDALFGRRAAEAPDRPAVVYGGEELRYGELEAQANRLARRLRRLGVGVESRVGLCVERSAGMVVGMLGILKAGGAYVPLDPSHPLERLTAMVEDAGVRVLVTEEARLGEVPATAERVVLGEEAEESAEVLARWSDPECLAYVTFTSGSTGRPKGIGVPHRAVVRLVEETNYVALGREDRIAQASNATFDAATFEVWGALLQGGVVWGIDRESTLAPASFAASLSSGGVSTLFLTTALFNQMAREAPGAFRGLRQLLFGGEAVESRWVGEVLEKGRPERLLHVYGPTEATTFSSWHLVEGVPTGGGPIPIGRGLSNARLYVVDGEQRLVPLSAAGELLIGGAGLARGYEGRPDLTAESFVPDGCGGEPGGRLYRTGDLVRWNGAGRLEFLGRRDQQVKVRGFRIELSEIESALVSHPSVAQSAVLVRELEHDGVRDRQLVAYVVLREGASSSAELDRELRDHLGKRLPSYMVPARLVVVDVLPLTAVGKVDRRALLKQPLPEAMSEGALAPRTPAEELVATIFAELLKVERVGALSSFFELGGHSLLATQLVSQLRQAFGVELPLRTVFEAPTVEGLARALEEAQRAGAGLAAPPIEPAPRTGDLPLSFAQERLWFIDQLAQGSGFYNVSHPIRLKGHLDLDALERSLSEIVRRHEVLRTMLPAVGGRPVQRIAPPGPLPLPRLDLSHLPEPHREAEVRRLVDEDGERTFRLARGPLVRALLIRLGEADHVACLTMHHVVSDGWSMGILVREVSALYPAFCEHRPSPLPELPIQYADFAVWQRSYLSGETLAAQLTYWRQRLGGKLPVLDLPTDRPRQRVQTFRGAIEVQHFPAALYPQLKRLGQSQGATLFMTLLAAFAALLHRTTGKDDLIVGTAVAGRNRAETEGLIGFFVNMLPIRILLTQNPTFLQLLARTREAALGAFTFQDIPLEKLIAELQPERYGSQSLLFEVAFGYRSETDFRLELPGITLEPVARERNQVRLDLSLWLIERAGTLSANWFFNTDLFAPSTIRRMAERFATLLAHVAEQPELPVGALRMVGEGERAELDQEQERKRQAEAQRVRGGRRKRVPLDGAASGGESGPAEEADGSRARD